MPEKVSIVIPHYGEAAPTLRLIGQLRAQEGRVETEIIVSDDASPEPFPQTDGCRVVRSTTNGGFGAAVNRGAALARHEALLVLNSDVEIETSFLEEIVAGATPWWPAVVSTAVTEGGQTRCVGRHWPTVASNTLETVDAFARFHGRAWFENLIGNDVESWRSPVASIVDWAVGVCLLMPTADFRAVDGVDERYFMNCEEIDLQRRLHEQRGLPVVVLPSPVLRHAGGGSSDPERRYGWLTDARFRYHEKWNGGPGLLVGLTLATASNLTTGTLRRLAGRDVTPMTKARRDASAITHGWRTRR